MKKRILYITITLFILLPLSPVPARALTAGDIVDITPILEDSFGELDFSAWEKYISDNDFFNAFTDGLSIKDYLIEVIRGNKIISLEGILSSAFGKFLITLRKHFVNIIILSVIALTSVISDRLSKDTFNGSIASMTSRILFFAATGFIIKGFCDILPLATDCIHDMCSFTESVLPFLMAFTAGSASNGVFGSGILVMINIASAFISSVMIPLVTFSAVLFLLYRIADRSQFLSVASLASRASDWLIGIAFTLLFGFVSVQKLTARSLSGLSFKTIRYTLSSFSIYGGSYLSKSFDLVTGCAVIMQSVVGSVGLVVLITLAIMPALELLAAAFVYRIGALIISFTGEERISGCLADMGRIYGTLFLCTVTVAALFFAVISAIATTGTGAL